MLNEIFVILRDVRHPRSLATERATIGGLGVGISRFVAFLQMGFRNSNAGLIVVFGIFSDSYGKYQNILTPSRSGQGDSKE